jgi:hypothetical protein
MRGKRLALMVLLAVAGLGLLGAWLRYAPLAGGTIRGSDAAAVLTTIEDDTGTTLVYRYAPGAELSTLASLRNDAPLPVTILGLEPPEIDVPLESLALLWPERLSLAGDGMGSVEIAASDAVAITTVELAPGAVQAFWITWRVGSLCPIDGPVPYGPGEAAIAGPTVAVRWSLLGMRRTSSVDVGYRVEALNPPDDPLTSCPES